MGNSLRSSADYKRALLVPIAVGILVMLLLFVGAEIFRHRTDLQLERVRSVAMARGAFALAVERDTDKLSAVMEAVTRDAALQVAYQTGDRQQLLAVADPLFQSLRKNHDITHFYFIRPDRRMFLRVQAPHRVGDLIERQTLLKAEQSGQTRAGLELGSLGVLTVRVVSPWRDAAGTLLGYVELGVEVDRTIARLQNLTGIDVLMLVDKQFLARDSWETGMAMIQRRGQWDRWSTHVLVGATNNVDSGLISDAWVRAVLGGKERQQITLSGRSLAAESAPIKDISGRQVGAMLILSDLTEFDARQRNFLVAVVVGALLVGGLLLLIARWVLDHVYGRLSKSRYQRDIFLKKAERDGLTRLYRREVFVRRLARECADAQRDAKPLAVLMIDVDWFKKVNDTYGHPQGDQVLRGVAQMISDSVRPGDLVARYGGEEFAVILADMEGDAASVVAERIRTSVESHTFDCDVGSFSVTLSIGGAILPLDGVTGEALIQAADRALYAAKNGGRNQTRISEPITLKSVRRASTSDRR